MRSSSVAAIAAALLAGLLLAASTAPDTQAFAGQPETRPDASGIDDVHAGHSLRGQAWATELFGRRYGRHLLAAVIADRADDCVGA